MTADLLYTASGFEILFLVSALVGAWFSSYNIRDSWADFRALGGITNGRRTIAVAAIVTETVRLSIHALYLIAVLPALALPSGPTTVIGVLIQAILVYASWAQTFISIIGRRTRVYLLTNGLQARGPDGKFIKEP